MWCAQNLAGSFVDKAAVLVDLQQGSRLIRRRAEYQDLLAYDVD